MNIVRLGMIVMLGGIAVYALMIYANMPPPPLVSVPTEVTSKVLCPTMDRNYGVGSVLVALTAIGGAITVAAVDLFRRVY